MRRTTVRRCAVRSPGLLALPAPRSAADYKIMAPAAPGGGWDQTARSMQAALQDEKISDSVQVTNVPGAGGTIGLAQFVNQASGDPDAADRRRLRHGRRDPHQQVAGDARPGDADRAPDRRVRGDRRAGRLRHQGHGRARREAEGRSRLGLLGRRLGGGTDHITAGLIAKAVGVDPTKVNYIAFSGGGEALAAILGNQVTVGISGYGEFAEQIKAGTLRIIGISSDERVAGIDAPTFKEGGVDVSIQNWRMVAAAPGITDEQKAAIIADVDKMVQSASWQKTLADKGWANTYLAGDAFAEQLKKDTEATAAILKDIGLVQ